MLPAISVTPYHEQQLEWRPSPYPTSTPPPPSPTHCAYESASVWLRVPTWPWLTLTWACCLAPLTVIADVLCPVERNLRGVWQSRGTEFQKKVFHKHRVVGGAVGAVGGIAADWVTHALLPQVAHEELQADEGKDAEAENGEDHDIWQLLYRLDQCANYGLQALKRKDEGVGWGKSQQNHSSELAEAEVTNEI